jgi:hypothetical protein
MNIVINIKAKGQLCAACKWGEKTQANCLLFNQVRLKLAHHWQRVLGCLEAEAAAEVLNEST